MPGEYTSEYLQNEFKKQKKENKEIFNNRLSR